ncbi:DUF368 domain-containing protein [Anaerovorax odorimutans]|uniref:DUF368 domain-containing protein n=1 Tax=Anaerovorax odorimutans TaxID=109327 RepID=UPI00041EE30A|nr:DUF368 domain-containing protein [Anaerovorax odorimutans]
MQGKGKDYIFIKLIKGFIIGSSMLIPGVSGGTMAIILGAYDDLIHAVSFLKKNVKTNGLLLIEYSLAGLLGILLMSGPMLDAVTAWRKPMMFLFLGAILGSISPLYRKATIDRVKPVNIGAVILGGSVAYLITLFPKGLLSFDSGFNVNSMGMLFIAGIIIAIALVLPGISGSYILLIFGMYDLTLKALRDFNILYLSPIIVGAIVGTFLTAGIIEREMKRHPQFTYMLIIGFMMGSLMEVYPGLPMGVEIWQCIGTFLFGLIIILWISKLKVK